MKNGPEIRYLSDGSKFLETNYRNGGQPLPIAREEMKPVKEVLA